MKTVHFICDESEAKGYADKDEKYPYEIGVVAGYFLPSDSLDEVNNDLETLTDKYKIDGKLHITDLEPSQQESIRNDIFDYFIKRNIICAYEVIYSGGFHDNYKRLEEIKGKFPRSKQSNISVNTKPKKEMLHVQLLTGAFAKAVSFCLDNLGDKFHLEIITDRVDKKIVDMFRKEADRFIKRWPSERIVKGYDREKGQKVCSKITTNVDSGNYLLDLSKVEYSVVVSNSPLTVAADILANSINYYFKSKNIDENGVLPNSPEAIPDHPLFSLFYGIWENKDINYFSDAIFMHPKKYEGTK